MLLYVLAYTVCPLNFFFVNYYLIGFILAVPMKLKRIQLLEVDPVIYQLYFSFSMFCWSWLVLAITHFEFSYYGKKVSGFDMKTNLKKNRNFRCFIMGAR